MCDEEGAVGLGHGRGWEQGKGMRAREGVESWEEYGVRSKNIFMQCLCGACCVNFCEYGKNE